MSVRVKAITDRNQVLDLSLTFRGRPVLKEFVMLSPDAAWYLGTRNLTALQYRVLFAAIGAAQFGGKVQIDKTFIAGMLGADRSSVSKAVSRLVELSILIDEGERFGQMRYYRLNRFLIVKGRSSDCDRSTDMQKLQNLHEHVQ